MPTAALGVAQTAQVLELVARLAEQGLAVVLISHNLHDIFEVATRITVLRLGRDVGVYERATTTQQEVVEAIESSRMVHVFDGKDEKERIEKSQEALVEITSVTMEVLTGAISKIVAPEGQEITEKEIESAVRIK